MPPAARMLTFEQAIRLLKAPVAQDDQRQVQQQQRRQQGMEACRLLLQHSDVSSSSSGTRVGHIAIPFLLSHPSSLDGPGWQVLLQVMQRDSTSCVTHTSLVMNKLAIAIQAMVTANEGEDCANDDYKTGLTQFTRWLFQQTYFCPTLDQVRTCVLALYSDSNDKEYGQEEEEEQEEIYDIVLNKFHHTLTTNNNARKVFTTVASSPVLLVRLPSRLLRAALHFRHAPYESILWETLNKHAAGPTSALARALPRLVSFWLTCDAELFPAMVDKIKGHSSDSLVALFTTFAQVRKDRLHHRDYVLKSVAPKILCVQQRDIGAVRALLEMEPDTLNTVPPGRDAVIMKDGRAPRTLLPVLLRDCARNKTGDDGGGTLLETLVHMHFRLRAVPDFLQAVQSLDNDNDDDNDDDDDDDDDDEGSSRPLTAHLTRMLGQSTSFCDGLATRVPRAQVAEVLQVFDTPGVYTPLFTLVSEHLVCDTLTDQAANVVQSMVSKNRANLSLLCAARDVLLLTRDTPEVVQEDWETHKKVLLERRKGIVVGTNQALVSFLYRAHYVNLPSICRTLAPIVIHDIVLSQQQQQHGGDDDDDDDGDDDEKKKKKKKPQRKKRKIHVESNGPLPVAQEDNSTDRDSIHSVILLALGYVDSKEERIKLLPRILSRLPSYVYCAEFWELCDTSDVTTAVIRTLTDTGHVFQVPSALWRQVDPALVLETVGKVCGLRNGDHDDHGDGDDDATGFPRGDQAVALRHLLFRRPDVTVPFVMEKVFNVLGQQDMEGKKKKKQEKKKKDNDKKRKRRRDSVAMALDSDLLRDVLTASCLTSSDTHLLRLVSSPVVLFDDLIFDHITAIDLTPESCVQTWEHRLDRVVAALDTLVTQQANGTSRNDNDDDDDDKALVVVEIASRAWDHKCLTIPLEQAIPCALARTRRAAANNDQLFRRPLLLARIAHVVYDTQGVRSDDDSVNPVAIAVARVLLPSDDHGAFATTTSSSSRSSSGGEGHGSHVNTELETSCHALFNHANVATFSALIDLVRDYDNHTHASTTSGGGSSGGATVVMVAIQQAIQSSKSTRVRRDILSRQALHIVPRLAITATSIQVATQLLLLASSTGNNQRGSATRAFGLFLERCLKQLAYIPLSAHPAASGRVTPADICHLLEMVIKHRVAQLVSPCISTFTATCITLVRHTLQQQQQQQQQVLTDDIPSLQRVFQQAAQQKLVFKRFAPMLLAELLAGFERHPFPTPQHRTLWMQGVNALFDLTSAQDLQLLHQSMHVAGRDLLSSCYKDYQSHYKYTGKV